MHYNLMEYNKGSVVNSGYFDSIEDFYKKKISLEYFPQIKKIDVHFIGTDVMQKIDYLDVFGLFLIRGFTKYYLKRSDGAIVNPKMLRTNWYGKLRFLIKPYYYTTTRKRMGRSQISYGISGLFQEKKSNITARELGFNVRKKRNHGSLWGYSGRYALKRSWKDKKVKKQWMSSKFEHSLKNKNYQISKEPSFKRVIQKTQAFNDHVNDHKYKFYKSVCGEYADKMMMDLDGFVEIN